MFRSDKDREMTIVIGNMDVVVMLTEDQLIRVLEKIVYQEIKTATVGNSFRVFLLSNGGQLWISS